MAAGPDVLVDVLRRGQRLGFLGPPPVEVHVAHARSFLGPVPAPDRALDLGSGGGVPGLVLALAWPGSRWTLLDAGERRTAFLASAVAELGLGDRVAVRRDRAEVAGRDPALRGVFDLVVARAFGRPAVTAECAGPFLRVGGRLEVSEPPDRPDRWDERGLAGLGLRLAVRASAGEAAVAVFERVAPCPSRFPRRVGVPAKRPLW